MDPNLWTQARSGLHCSGPLSSNTPRRVIGNVSRYQRPAGCTLVRASESLVSTFVRCARRGALRGRARSLRKTTRKGLREGSTGCASTWVPTTTRWRPRISTHSSPPVASLPPLCQRISDNFLFFGFCTTLLLARESTATVTNDRMKWLAGAAALAAVAAAAPQSSVPFSVGVETAWSAPPLLLEIL